MKCEKAWDWILESYCIKHEDNGEVVHEAYGCSYGAGAGVGNGGFRKGVAIETHDVLEMGQDPLDIKNLENEE